MILYLKHNSAVVLKLGKDFNRAFGFFRGQYLLLEDMKYDFESYTATASSCAHPSQAIPKYHKN